MYVSIFIDLSILLYFNLSISNSLSKHKYEPSENQINNKQNRLYNIENKFTFSSNFVRFLIKRLV